MSTTGDKQPHFKSPIYNISLPHLLSNASQGEVSVGLSDLLIYYS